MDTQKVDMYIMTHAKYFESYQVPAVREMLLSLDDSKWMAVQTLEIKDPTIILIVSLLAGTLGIDRFMIGDTGMGVGKLLTCGGFGIWALVDLFLIMGATKEKNLARLQQIAIY